MAAVAFLCDECVPDDVVACALGLEPSLPIYCVGQQGFPSKGSKDPELLLFGEAMEMALVIATKARCKIIWRRIGPLATTLWGCSCSDQTDRAKNTLKVSF